MLPALSPIPPAMLQLRASGQPPRGRLTPPGDAALCQLALLLALLAVGRSRISGVVESDAVLCAADAVRAFGGEVDRLEPGVFAVQGVGLGGLLEPVGRVALPQGEEASWILALAATHHLRTVLGPRDAAFTELAALLARFGARIPAEQEQFVVSGPATAIPASFAASSVSDTDKVALMLASLNAPGISSIAGPLGRLRRAMLLFDAFGATVRQDSEAGFINVHGLPELRPAEVAIPPDPMLSAIAIAAAAIRTGSDLVIADQPVDAGRERFLSAMSALGATVERGSPSHGPAGGIADVRVRQAGRARPMTGLPDVPDPENVVLRAALSAVAGDMPSGPGLAEAALQALLRGTEGILAHRTARPYGIAELERFLAALGLAISPSAP